MLVYCPEDLFALKELLQCQTDIIWWPIIYALIAVFGTIVLIFMLSQNSPPNLLPCVCPVEDFAIINGTAVIVEGRALALPINTFTLLNYVGVGAPFTNNSSTSNPSKFGFVIPIAVQPPQGINYTPVFNGISPAKIAGSVASSIRVTTAGTSVTIGFGIAWTNNNGTTWTTIAQSSMRTSAPIPGWITFSLPFAASFTRAQMSTSGSVRLSGWIESTALPDDVRYGVASITLLVAEV